MSKKIIINIGRQFGSGGRAVARALGSKLDIPVYDYELLNKAAEDSGFSRDLFKKKDEKHRPFSLKGAFGDGLKFDDFSNGFLGEGELFRMQSETILKIAEKGSAVIVGRCADYILRNMDCTLDVFLTSPMEARLDCIMKRHNVDEKTAALIIARKDKSRSAYYNYYTFQDWGVAKTYDLCLDTTILGIEGTADFIVEFARRAGKL